MNQSLKGIDKGEGVTTVDGSPSQAGGSVRLNTHFVHRAFEAQVKETPNAIAVIHRREVLSYSQLNGRANQLARFLMQRGVQANQLVGLCLPRSTDMMIAILAVWKAGAAYVPIDPAYPNARINHLLDDSAVNIVITHAVVWAELVDKFTSRRAIEACFLGENFKELLDDFSVADIGNDLREDALAYVIYTSGSTGIPKGVLVEHRSVMNLFRGLASAIDIATFPKPYNALQNASIAFDSSVKQTLHILHGGALHILPEEVRLNPKRFLDYLRNNNIYCFDCTPSLLKQLVRESAGQPLVSHAACLLVGGEVIDRPLWTALANMKPMRSYNVYGPTECTVDSTIGPIIAADSIPVIGKPLPGIDCFLLNQDLQLADNGEIAELYIGGAGVARGYLKRPELTAEKFIQAPSHLKYSGVLYKTGDLARLLPDGNLEFVGRNDNQVKVRGFRIELEEIERVLLSCAGVSDAAVCVKGKNVEDKVLIGFLIRSSLSGDDSADADFTNNLRKELRSLLPEYMVPDVLHTVLVFPLTLHGKVDRAALLDTHSDSFAVPADQLPKTPTEKLLAPIWRDLLGIAQVGRNEDFFSLGGHSLLIMQMISSIRRQFGIEMASGELFAHTTIRELAAAIDSQKTSAKALEPLHNAPDKTQYPLSFEEELLFRFGGHLSPPMLLRFTLEGNFDVSGFLASVRAVVRRHEILGSTVQIDSEPFVHRACGEEAFKLDFIDLSMQKTVDAQVEQTILQLAYSLDANTLSRAALFCVAPGRYVFVLTLGHMVSDIWSFEIFLRELTQHYRAVLEGEPPTLKAPAIQYRDYSYSQRRWLENGRYIRALEYWTAILETIPSPLPLPTDRRRKETPLYLMKTVPILLPRDLMSAVADLCGQTATTPYMVLLAAFNALLAKISGQNDIAVICPASSRSYTELEEIIGCFLNLLILRNTVEPQMNFLELLQSVKSTTIDAYNHQDVPSLLLQGALAQKLGFYPIQLFQICFDFNPEIPSLELPGLATSAFMAEQLNFPEPRTGVAFDFIWMLRDGPDGVSGRVSYNAELFDEVSVIDLVGQYVGLLAALVGDPGHALPL